MKRFIIVLVIIKSVCVLSNLDLTTNKKDEAATTTLNKMEETTTGGKKQGSVKTFDRNESRVYIEDVVYALKYQDWMEDEMGCLNQTLLLLQSLQNFTLWAVWDWDSISSQPLGLLYGSQYHLGNFDECLDTPWHHTHPALQSQYCLADIILERTDKQARKKSVDRSDPYQSALQLIEIKSKFERVTNKLTWGICVPVQCKPRSVERLTGVLLAQTHLAATGLRAHISANEECQRANNSWPYDGLFYAFIGVTSFLLIITLICTFIRSGTKNNTTSVTNSIIEAFDIGHNANRLLNVSDDGTQVLYGIKFLSICVIVIGHNFGMFSSGPISNWDWTEKELVPMYGSLLLHDDIVVDSFFTMSGFLTAIAFAKLKTFGNPLIMIIRRYFRLVTAYAFVIFFMASIYPHIGSGPLWNRAAAGDTIPCRQNWWLNILMLSNYIDTENVCIVVSWYIPCDFHFFLVAVFLYWLYTRFPRLAKRLAAALTVVVAILPGYTSYINKFPPIQAFTFDFITNPRMSKQFQIMYIKSHLRGSTYVVGFFSGLVYARSSLKWLKELSRRQRALLAYLCAVVMVLSLYLGTLLFWGDFHPLVDAAYAALNRPVWAVALSIIILCCCAGHVPILRGVLSWYPFVPLSRLTYGLYLTHTILILRNVFITRNLQQHDPITILTLSFGVIFWSCVASLALWLLAEAPINNLITLCLTGPRKNIEKQETTAETPQTKGEGGAQYNSGYLEENLPGQIISSKF